MGHIVENNVILHALNKQLEQCSGVEVRRGLAIDDITMTSVSIVPWDSVFTVVSTSDVCTIGGPLPQSLGGCVSVRWIHSHYQATG